MPKARRPAIALLALFSGAVLAGSPDSSTPTPTHERLDRVLAATVRETGVDYSGLRERHLAELERYLDEIAAAQVQELERAEHLALTINLYNATVLRAVAERYRPGYSVAENSFRIFDEPLVRLEGRTITLNDLEHRVIRPGFGEPRVHAALVCAARSCPPLLPRAYRGVDLDRLLERQMRKFLDDRSRNRVDHAARTLRLSRVFEWYAEDFGGPDGIRAYVGRYAGADLSHYALSFLPYSWELNEASD